MLKNDNLNNKNLDVLSDFFSLLELSGQFISNDKKERILKKTNEMLSYEPKVGIFGKTGAGKSSLCNSLFGKDVCNISDVEACTREPQNVILSIGKKGIRLIDVPGVGESSERDKEYSALYSKLLPELDLILWVLKGDDRAYSSDEKFYKDIVRPHIESSGKPFFIVLNQIDKIEPFREWNEKECKPGEKQLLNIENKKSSVSKFFDMPNSKIIAVSANEKYNLVELVDEITYSLPDDKKVSWVREVNNTNPTSVSENAKKEASEGFFKIIYNYIGDKFSSIKSKISSLFDRFF